MYTCAYCKNVFFGTRYFWTPVEYGHSVFQNSDIEYVTTFNNATSNIVFCSESCRQSWLNEFNGNWEQKKAAEEAAKEAVSDEQERSEHTLRCDQCGRELPAVRNNSGDWDYPRYWNFNGVGVYCSNGCCEAAKASGLVARQLARVAALGVVGGQHIARNCLAESPGTRHADVGVVNLHEAVQHANHHRLVHVDFPLGRPCEVLVVRVQVDSHAAVLLRTV